MIEAVDQVESHARPTTFSSYSGREVKLMQRLLAKVRQIEEANKNSAIAGCMMADGLEADLSPSRLGRAQNSIRPMLLAIQRHLRDYEARRTKRGPRIARLLARRPGLRRSMGDHNLMLQAREAALRVSEAIQRQVGDAFAWLVLRSDPGIISPLFEARSHQLPDQVGLSGPVLLANAAHDTGKWLVVDNDLTRCLGIGDLTVVSTDGKWRRPFSLEIKSSLRGQEFKLGAQVDSEVITSVSDDPVDAAAWQDFRTTLGLRDQQEGDRPSRNSEAQANEILEHSKLLGEVTGRIRGQFRSPKDLLWLGVERVLSSAMTQGSYYDLIDEGIMAVGIRMREGVDMEAETRRVLAELQQEGYAGREGLIQATSFNLRDEDWLAPYVPPIPLWPLPLPLRVALLTGELFYSCAYDQGIWQRAMTKTGVQLKEEDGNWVLQKGDKTTLLDHIAVMKLTLGVLFSGVRPSEVASIVAEALSAR